MREDAVEEEVDHVHVAPPLAAEHRLEADARRVKLWRAREVDVCRDQFTHRQQLQLRNDRLRLVRLLRMAPYVALDCELAATHVRMDRHRTEAVELVGGAGRALGTCSVGRV